MYHFFVNRWWYGILKYTIFINQCKTTHLLENDSYSVELAPLNSSSGNLTLLTPFQRLNDVMHLAVLVPRYRALYLFNRWLCCQLCHAPAQDIANQGTRKAAIKRAQQASDTYRPHRTLSPAQIPTVYPKVHYHTLASNCLGMRNRHQRLSHLIDFSPSFSNGLFHEQKRYYVIEAANNCWYLPQPNCW